MPAIWIAFSSLLFLVGCETAPSFARVSDLSRDLSPSDVSFELNQDVVVPAGRARLFLQDGGIVGGRNLYRPHCIFEIGPVNHNGFEVSAATFDVVRIQRSTVQIAAVGPYRLASAGMVAGSFRNGSTSRFHDGYHFWLQSDSEPAVRRLTCYGIFERPARLRTPTLEEIAVALGELGTLRVASTRR